MFVLNETLLISDTVVTAIKADSLSAVSRQEAIALYSLLLQQENTNHTNFLLVIVGTIVLFISATWWWNKSEAKKLIKSETARLFAEGRVRNEELMKIQITKQIDQNLNEYYTKWMKQIGDLEFEITRSMATQNYSSGNLEDAIGYASNTVLLAVKLEKQELTRFYVERLLHYLTEYLRDPKSRKTVRHLDLVKSDVESIPALLNKEKVEIKRLLQQCTTSSLDDL